MARQPEKEGLGRLDSAGRAMLAGLTLAAGVLSSESQLIGRGAFLARGTEGSEQPAAGMQRSVLAPPREAKLARQQRQQRKKERKKEKKEKNTIVHTSTVQALFVRGLKRMS